MKNVFLAVLLCSVALLFHSCESCVKSATKKATELGLSAVEGVSEAISEKGEKTTEKVTDALGEMAKGAGRSIERQLNEHAEDVASAAGRTLVQSLEGFEKGLTKEYYEELPNTTDLPGNVTLELFGKIQSKALVDAYFIILETGTYNCTFDFTDASGKVLMTKTATIEKTETERKYSIVSFALNSSEEQSVKDTKNTKITILKK